MRWLRRVSFDLVGLPPTLAERSSFKTAYEQDPEAARIAVVDRLLTSPRFGERWASVWFDLVRYADSRGQGEDSPRTIWKYRDWVIDAMNADMPYSDFTIKQLAGDMLPNRTLEDHVATAVHRLTHTNEEGGTDDEEFRVESVLDRVNTTWQGTTFGCVQCHHHPYDPFDHDEYYKFVALFNNTVDCDLSDDWPYIKVPIDTADYAKAGELKSEIEALRHSIWQTNWGSVSMEQAESKLWRPLPITKASTNRQAKLLVDKKDGRDEFYTSGTISSGTTLSIETKVEDLSEPVTGIRITGLPLDPETALANSEWGFVMSRIKAEFVYPNAQFETEMAEWEKQMIDFRKLETRWNKEMEAAKAAEAKQAKRKDAQTDSETAKSGKGKPAASIGKNESAANPKSKTKSRPKAPAKPQAIKKAALKFAQVYCDNPFPRYDPNQSLNPKSKEGFATYTQIHHPRQAVLVLESAMEVPAGAKLKFSILHRVTELAAFPMLTRRGYFEISTNPSLIDTLNDDSVQQQKAEQAKKQKQIDKIESSTVPVLVERESHLARPSHVFVRGLFLTKGKEVFGDVPKSLRVVSDPEPLSNRLAVARWMVGANNPLTARVAVNRYWARMFGVGLVATEEDFGSTGDLPSHPELLDDLAVRFREDHKWSVKSLLKEIALSRTYLQSSRIRPELVEADANNRWLARGPRHSLPAEAVRDQMLAISGLLSDKMHGEPVYPPLPPGVWKARRGTWKTPKEGDEDRYRRSVYTYVKRSVPFPILTTFDAPSRDFCLPKRLRSNTPLQPLMLLNDRGFVECAQAFAKRMLASGEQLEQQIEFGLELATCRKAKPEEVSRLAELHAKLVSESGQQLAMDSVASVILNLDEVITK